MSTKSTVRYRWTGPTARLTPTRVAHRYGTKLNCHSQVGESGGAGPAVWASRTGGEAEDAVRLRPVAPGASPAGFASYRPNGWPSAHPMSAWAVHGMSPVTRATGMSPAHRRTRLVKSRGRSTEAAVLCGFAFMGISLARHRPLVSNLSC